MESDHDWRWEELRVGEMRSLKVGRSSWELVSVGSDKKRDKLNNGGDGRVEEVKKKDRGGDLQ